MTEWDERLSNAATWGYVGKMRQQAAGGADSADAVQRTLLDRISWLLALLPAYRKVDARLVTATMIQALDASVGRLASEVATWSQNGSEQNLSTAANREVDAVLDALRGWPSVKNGENHRATVVAAQKYRVEAEKAIHELEQALTRIREQASEVGAEARNSRQAAEDDLTALRREISSLEADITGEKDRIARALETNEEAFTSAEEQRASAFLQSAEGSDQKVRAALDKIEADAGAAATEARSGAESTLERLTALERQAAELVDVISIEGTATGYARYAQQERKAAWVWSAGAVALGLGGFFVILWALHGVEATTSWREIITKIVASLTLGGIATYCGNQSSQHRQQERQAKRMELDIAALNPFINNLQKEDQDKIRATFAERMFILAPPSTPILDDAASTAVQAAPQNGKVDSIDLNDVATTLAAATQAVQKLAR